VDSVKAKRPFADLARWAFAVVFRRSRVGTGGEGADVLGPDASGWASEFGCNGGRDRDAHGACVRVENGRRTREGNSSLP